MNVTNFSHIQMFNYSIRTGNILVEQVALFNCNKLPTGVAFECARNNADNPYLLTMPKSKFDALFLDDNVEPTETVREVDNETEEDNN